MHFTYILNIDIDVDDDIAILIFCKILYQYSIEIEKVISSITTASSEICCVKYSTTSGEK